MKVYLHKIWNKSRVFSVFYKRKQYLVQELKENETGELSNKCQYNAVWRKKFKYYVYRKRN